MVFVPRKVVTDVLLMILSLAWKYIRGDIRIALLHMREGKLGQGKHLHNVRLKDILDLIEINLFEIRTHELLRGVVDEDIDSTESTISLTQKMRDIPLNMLVNGILAKVPAAKITRKQMALAPCVLDQLLRALGVFLFGRQIDNRHVGAFSSIQGCNGTSDARASY